MGDNENKRASGALPDEALDKVAGGKVSQDFFKERYCQGCRHVDVDCPYGTQMDAVIAMGGASQCPSKET